MDALQNLVSACQADENLLRQQAQFRTESWQPWLAPLSDTNPTGKDPGYDDDFQRIREEVNKLSGIDSGLICTLAEKLLTTAAKDIRIATYYCWARLHQDGEAGFAEGLELLAGLLRRYGMQLHPQRDRSRRAALEWLAGTRVLDSLSLYPEVVREDALRTAGALLLIRDRLETEPEASRPELNALYSALESRLMKAGVAGTGKTSGTAVAAAVERCQHTGRKPEWLASGNDDATESERPPERTGSTEGKIHDGQ